VLDRPRDPVADRREAPDASPPAGSRLEAGHPGRMTEGPDPQGLEPNLPEGAGAHVQSGPAVPEASAAAEAGSQGSTPGQPAQNGASAPSGPAANGPGKNPPVESPDGAQRTPPEGAVGARGASGATGPVHVLNLRLEPPHLGPVRVRVRVEGESVQALFVTDAARQKAALDGGLPLLRHGLVEQGLSVQDLAVHVGSQDGGGGSYRRPQDGDGPVGPPPCRPSDLIPPGPERPEAAATVLRPGGALDVRI
jgi:flagellar hook-length control protein FliK